MQNHYFHRAIYCNTLFIKRNLQIRVLKQEVVLQTFMQSMLSLRIILVKVLTIQENILTMKVRSSLFYSRDKENCLLAQNFRTMH